MGGCRCSYKNCTGRSDGRTHLFHYPVLDKVRCLLWLKNANKLEFLDLTVAQLRNRVVCQHHFLLNQFMNYKKDKLTFSAVPTEDGPLCEPEKGNNTFKLESLSIEDIIEHEISLVDSNYRPNFSKRYIDFLTNGDVNDLSQLNQYPKLNNNKAQKSLEVTKLTGNKESFENVLVNSYDKCDEPKKNVDPYILTFEQPKHNNDNLKKNKNIKNDYLDDNLQLNISNNINSPNKLIEIELPALNTFSEKTEPSNNGATKGNKIQIISEKTVNSPLTAIIGELNPISPSKPIEIGASKKTKKNTYQVTEQDLLLLNNTDNERYFTSLQNKEGSNEIESFNKTIEKKNFVSNEKAAPEFHNGKINEASSMKKMPNKGKNRNSCLRNSLTLERKTAIEEKRKFNKKVASETGLSKLRENLLNNYQTNFGVSKDVNKDVGLIRLEAKLEQMQNLLLLKIDQNSRKINDLKDVIKPKPEQPSFENKQTSTNLDNYRKYLFQEISQFLSPATNNLLYEELFLSKFSEEAPEPKKRKKR